MRVMLHVFGLILFVLLSTVPAFGQTSVNGSSGFQFTPSPDHSALNEDGSEKVQQYQGDIVTGTGLFWSQTWPKSGLVVTSGVIQIRPWAVLGTLNYGTIYTMTVTAVGPGGTGTSEPSDPFVRLA